MRSRTFVSVGVYNLRLFARVCVCLLVCLCLSPCLSLSVSVSSSVCVCLLDCLCLCLSPCLSVSVSVSLSVCVCLLACLCLSPCLSVSVSLSVCGCIRGMMMEPREVPTGAVACRDGREVACFANSTPVPEPGGRPSQRRYTTLAANSKHWFTTSFLQSLPYLVTP